MMERTYSLTDVISHQSDHAFDISRSAPKIDQLTMKHHKIWGTNIKFHGDCALGVYR